MNAGMMNIREKILVVDDEDDIVEFISYNLKKEGFKVNKAYNGKAAIEIAKNFKPDLILLDIMMPEMDGIETCEELRSLPEFSDTIIAFLSARSEDYTQIAGFQAGADDFIPKPIRPKVLTSRVKALLKRLSNSVKEIENDTKPGEIIIDKERYLVFKGKEELELPKKEFTLLSLLTSRPSRIFTREEIFDSIWGDDVYVSDRTIDVYIRKIREKIGEHHIKTVKGVGYKYIA